MTGLFQQDTRDSIFGLLPDMAGRFSALYASLWQQAHVPPATLELCRLRIAQLHHSRVDLARCDAAIDERQKTALEHWHRSDAFSAAEKACLDFCEVYAMDCQAISDEQADAVKEHLGDAGLVALIEALGIFDGMTRLSLVWQLPAGADT